jgi:hypothetical protein
LAGAAPAAVATTPVATPIVGAQPASGATRSDRAVVVAIAGAADPPRAGEGTISPTPPAARPDDFEQFYTNYPRRDAAAAWAG